MTDKQSNVATLALDVRVTQELEGRLRGELHPPGMTPATTRRGRSGTP